MAINMWEQRNVSLNSVVHWIFMYHSTVLSTEYLLVWHYYTIIHIYWFDNRCLSILQNCRCIYDAYVTAYCCYQSGYDEKHKMSWSNLQWLLTRLIENNNWQESVLQSAIKLIDHAPLLQIIHDLDWQTDSDTIMASQ